jgi:hypothetical protein
MRESILTSDWDLHLLRRNASTRRCSRGLGNVSLVLKPAGGLAYGWIASCVVAVATTIDEVDAIER